MNNKNIKTKQLEKKVIAKLRGRLENAKKSGLDLEFVKTKLLASLKEKNESKALSLLTDIHKALSNDEMIKVMQDVIKAIKDNKITLPKSFEVIMSVKPEWYVEPSKEVVVTNAIEIASPVQVDNVVDIKGQVEIENVVEVKGQVKADIDWLSFGSILNVAFSGLFEVMKSLSNKVFRVMPSKEHYTTPQMVVLVDSKSGKPFSLKDIGANNKQTVVVQQGGSSSGGSSSIDAVGIKDVAGAKINPATTEKQDASIALLEDIKTNTANININVDNVDINTDQLEQKTDTMIVNQVTMETLVETLQELASRLVVLSAVRGISADLRVTPLSTPNMATLTTLTGQTNIGGYSAITQIPNANNSLATLANINNVIPA